MYGKASKTCNICKLTTVYYDKLCVKVAALCLTGANAKTSFPLADCYVNHSTVVFLPRRHNALMRLFNVIDLMSVIKRQIMTSCNNVCVEITFSSRAAIPF